MGEGNFSFARALVRLFQGNGENVLATAFDAEEVVKAKYEDACEILEECRDCDVTVRFGVDATKLQQTLKLPPGRRTAGVSGRRSAGSCSTSPTWVRASRTNTSTSSRTRN